MNKLLCSNCKLPVMDSYFKNKKYAFCSYECFLEFFNKLSQKYSYENTYKLINEKRAGDSTSPASINKIEKDEINK